MADIVTLALEELEHRGGADALALAGRSVSGEARRHRPNRGGAGHPHLAPPLLSHGRDSGGQALPVERTGLPPLAAARRHRSAGWSPDLAFSLWDICHTTDPARAKDYLPPQGSRGLWQTGECCVFGGRVWRSRQDRNAYSPSELPASWEDLGSVQGSSFS